MMRLYNTIRFVDKSLLCMYPILHLSNHLTIYIIILSCPPNEPLGCISIMILLMFQSLNMVGFLQLAGGTNAYTIDGLKKGLFQTTITGNAITWLLCTLLLFTVFSIEFISILVVS